MYCGQTAPTTSIYTIWTDSDKTSFEGWISKFKNVSRFDEFVLDKTNVAIASKKNLCYTITRNTNNSTAAFTFSVQDCGKKAQPVCMIQKQSVYPGQAIPKFPCVKSIGLNRKKRTADWESNPKPNGRKQPIWDF